MNNDDSMVDAADPTESGPDAPAKARAARTPIRSPITRALKKRTGPGRVQRAAQRDEALRDDPRETATGDGAVRKQRRRGTQNREDKFRIDRKTIPQGMDYNWKREACYGQPDHDNMINMREDGWTPVPASRHGNLMPEGTSPSAPVRKDGMILMERPMYLTEEARQEDYANAREQVTGKERDIRETPNGQAPRKLASINKTIEHIPIE